MRGIITAIGCRRLCDFDQFLRVRIAARRIDQPGTHAECACFHRLRHELPHPLQLRFRRLFRAVAHRTGAHGAMPHEHAEVHRRLCAFHGGKERGHAGPPFFFSFRRRAPGRAAVACDLRRYPLQDAALRRWACKDAVVAVGMDVDKPRREVMILRVDGLPRFALKFPDRGDPAALYRYVRPVPRRTCSIHDSCIPDDQIIHVRFLLFILLTLLSLSRDIAFIIMYTLPFMLSRFLTGSKIVLPLSVFCLASLQSA